MNRFSFFLSLYTQFKLFKKKSLYYFLILYGGLIVCQILSFLAFNCWQHLDVIITCIFIIKILERLLSGELILNSLSISKSSMRNHVKYRALTSHQIKLHLIAIVSKSLDIINDFFSGEESNLNNMMHSVFGGWKRA